MGARIAAHLANAGIDTFLLDVASPEGERNRAAQEGLRAALAARPPAFFTRESAQLITTGNFEDNLEWCRQADWIIEAVAENIEIKRALLREWSRIAAPRQSFPQTPQVFRLPDWQRRDQRIFGDILPGRISSILRAT